MYINDEQYKTVVSSLVSAVERASKKEDATADELQALAAVAGALAQFVRI